MRTCNNKIGRQKLKGAFFLLTYFTTSLLYNEIYIRKIIRSHNLCKTSTTDGTGKPRRKYKLNTLRGYCN